MVHNLQLRPETEIQTQENWELEDFKQSSPVKAETCTVLIGGTPYPPNSRLLSYLTPAAELVQDAEEPKVILSSTATGGARWNYPGQADQIMRMTEIKQQIGAMGLERFFGVEGIPKTIEELPADTTLQRLWAMAKKINPTACREYTEAAHRFTNNDQDADAAGLYGVMHTIWAGDIAVEGITPPQAIDQIGVSYGGAKEAAFNLARLATTEIGADLLSEIFQKQIAVREMIFRIVDPSYNAPVPYGEMRAKLVGKNEGPVDVRLAGQEQIGSQIIDFDERGPFDLFKPGKKCSQRLLTELDALVAKIASSNNLTAEEAREEYEDFWKQCQDLYKTTIHNILRNE